MLKDYIPLEECKNKLTRKLAPIQGEGIVGDNSLYPEKNPIFVKTIERVVKYLDDQDNIVYETQTSSNQYRSGLKRTEIHNRRVGRH